jgi:ABC-type Fe3+-hydroxamate transport system substrate-binding protein
MLGLPELDYPPRRVVSLVPSMTESLFELGIGEWLVGVTDYCTSPASQTARLPKVGGPKTANLQQILALHPDLVVANREENSREVIEQLVAAGVPVWLGFPKSVRESLDELWALERLFCSKQSALQLRLLEDSLKFTQLAQADLEKKRYFCPIWQEKAEDGTQWWMTFNRHTYSSDLLALCGGENVFSERLRRYPLSANWGQSLDETAGDRDVRYPIVTIEDVCAGLPEMILLPSEPYAYQARHLDEINFLFADTPAVKNKQVFFLDGSLITWHGTRLGKALAALPQIFS